MKRSCLTLLLLMLCALHAQAQARPPGTGSDRALQGHVGLHLAPAFGRHDDDTAAVYGLQLELTTTGPLWAFVEGSRWDSPPHACPAEVGVYCAPFLEHSLEAGLGLRPLSGTRVEPHASASLGALWWNGRRGALAAARVGADIRVAENVSIMLRASQRRVVSGPLHHGERLRYELVGAGLRLSTRPLRQRQPR
jgi:hypothetical protein